MYSQQLLIVKVAIYSNSIICPLKSLFQSFCFYIIVFTPSHNSINFDFTPFYINFALKITYIKRN